MEFLPKERIFPIPEIDALIESYLDQLFRCQTYPLINKYYYQLMTNSNKYHRWKDFYENFLETKNLNESQDEKFLVIDKKSLTFPNRKFQLFYHAFRNGYVYTSKYLYHRYNLQNYYFSKHGLSLFIKGCREGYLDLVKWIYSLRARKKSFKFNIHHAHEKAFRKCCGNGHLEVAKYLIGIANLEGKSIKIDAYDYKTHTAFTKACQGNHKHICQWLVEYGREKNTPINIHSNIEAPFKSCCCKGHFELAKWLYHVAIELNSPIYSRLINQVNYRHNTFHKVCEHGHLQIAKWLIKISRKNGSPINIHDEVDGGFGCSSDDSFLISCQNGHFDVVKWFGELFLAENYKYPQKILVLAFTLACQFGHIEIAKWLYEFTNQSQLLSAPIYNKQGLSIDRTSLDHDIDFPFVSNGKNLHNHLAFRMACATNKIDIAKWLCILNSSYFIKINDRNMIIDYGLHPKNKRQNRRCRPNRRTRRRRHRFLQNKQIKN